MLASAGGQIDGRAYPIVDSTKLEHHGPGERGCQANGGGELPLFPPRSRGLPQSPQEDLKYHGGHTIKD